MKKRLIHGSKQSLDTLINEEAYLLAKYLRNERQKWILRTALIRARYEQATRYIRRKSLSLKM
jgi:hypothetical protein